MKPGMLEMEYVLERDRDREREREAWVDGEERKGSMEDVLLLFSSSSSLLFSILGWVVTIWFGIGKVYVFTYRYGTVI